MRYYYQAIRIFKNGIPTYGDMYKRIITDRKLPESFLRCSDRETAKIGNDEYIILFEEEEDFNGL